MSITLEQLQSIIPNAGLRAGVFHGPLGAAMEEFGIVSPLDVAAFIATIAHESGSLQRVSENLNYRPEAILATFNTPHVIRFTQEQANEYGRTADHPANQEMIANIAYANRMGNGDAASGDGWRTRGAGLIQETGTDNHNAVADHFGIPRANVGDWMRTPEGAARSAGLFWSTHGLTALAEAGDFRAVTKRVNGAYNGWDDRLSFYERAKPVLGV